MSMLDAIYAAACAGFVVAVAVAVISLHERLRLLEDALDDLRDAMAQMQATTEDRARRGM